MLSAGQDWWYESWTVSDWFGTFLNQPIEVHTLVLGAFGGILLGTVTVRCRPTVPSAFAFGAVLFALGAGQFGSVCEGAYRGCKHIRLKPWYFLGGFLLTHVLTVGMVEPVSRSSEPTERRRPSSMTPFLGLLVVTLLGFALYSFRVPEPVQPITGFSTIAGFAGSISSFAVFHRTRSSERGDRGVGSFVRQVASRRRSEFVHLVTFGTAFGFGFPRIVWEAGDIIGRENVAVGVNASLESTLLAVGLYSLAIVCLSLLLLIAFHRQRDARGLDRQLVLTTLFGNVSYAGCLLVAVSLSGFG